MNWNFELILFYATVVTGVIVLFDALCLKRKRVAASPDASMPIIIDYARAFFPILLIVFLLRSFLFEPFRIPSSSLEPTLKAGDFILVNKFDYGVRLPVWHTKLTKGNEVKRGDIIVFRWPANTDVVFIKRVIGVPGDKISYLNKQLTVNGEKIPQTLLRENTVIDDSGVSWLAQLKEEDLLGVQHQVYLDDKKKAVNYTDLTVPPNMYFVMGDNRDNSDDSRYWGFVPDENIVGKAVLVWMSFKSEPSWVRWDRIGKVIK